MRTLVRSPVERGMMIIIMQPLSNSTHSSSSHYLGSPPLFQHLSQKPESIPFGRSCL
jgi:hypothetical protein